MPRRIFKTIRIGDRSNQKRFSKAARWSPETLRKKLKQKDSPRPQRCLVEGWGNLAAEPVVKPGKTKTGNGRVYKSPNETGKGPSPRGGIAPVNGAQKLNHRSGIASVEGQKSQKKARNGPQHSESKCKSFDVQ